MSLSNQAQVEKQASEVLAVGCRGHQPLERRALTALLAHNLHCCGDSLFPGGPGKTAGPAEFGSLMDDLEERIFGALPDETWVYPGHGDETTLGAERPHLGEGRERGW
jgi:glyoxylase-like metal-dependent hydrolase (beta-lactamase superfamily II)